MSSAYQEAYSPKGELLAKKSPFFHVTVSEGQPLYGSAQALAENACCSVDGLFYSGNGRQNGVTVHNIEGIGVSAVTWQGKTSDTPKLIMATDGANVFVSDPVFLPIGDPCGSNDSGVSIGIQGNDAFASYQKRFPWLSSVAEHFGLNHTKEVHALTLEEMASQVKRKINEAQVRARRSHF